MVSLNTCKTMLMDSLLDLSGRLLALLLSFIASVLADLVAQSSWKTWPMIQPNSRELHGAEIQTRRKKRRRRKIAPLTQVMMRKEKRKRSKRPSSTVIHSMMDMQLNTRIWVLMAWTLSTRCTVADLHFQDHSTTIMLCLNMRARVLEDHHSSHFQLTCNSHILNEDLLRVETHHSCLIMVKVANSPSDKTRTAWCVWPKRQLSKLWDRMVKWWPKEHSKLSNNTLMSMTKMRVSRIWALTKILSTKRINTKSRSSKLRTIPSMIRVLWVACERTKLKEDT